MDVHYIYRGQQFVWDGAKAIENRAKHGITFEVACEVFFDPEQESEEATDDDEFRLAVIGMTTQSKLLYVVHVEREGQKIRIISAREVSTRERNLYEDCG